LWKKENTHPGTALLTALAHRGWLQICEAKLGLQPNKCSAIFPPKPSSLYANPVDGGATGPNVIPEKQGGAGQPKICGVFFHLRTQSTLVAQLSVKLDDRVRQGGGRRRGDKKHEHMMIN